MFCAFPAILELTNLNRKRTEKPSLNSLSIIMVRLTFLVSAVLSMASFQGANAAISYNPFLTCATQIIEGESQRICYTDYRFTAIPQMENGTTTYVGPTGYDFTFYKGLAANTDTSLLTDAQNAKYLLPNTVSVSWDDGVCQVKVGGTKCSSCTICSELEFNPPETTLSADCTNIDGGRKATCEKALVYYPLKKNKRSNGGNGKPQMGMMMKGGMHLRK